MQHRAKTPVRGRHRRPAPPLHSRLLASPLLGDRGRYAALTAVLMAGAGTVAVAAGGAADAAVSPGNKAAVHRLATGYLATDRQPDAAAPGTARQSVVGPQGAPAPQVAGHGAHRAVAAPAAARPRATGAADGTPAATLSDPAFLPAQLKVRPQVTSAAAPQWVDPILGARVTSCFGHRWGRLHAGVDLAAPHGTRVRAVGAGTVVSAGVNGGYGNAVLVDHGNGFLTHYGHLSTIAVLVGQRVEPGTPLGDEGSTGHSTGPHLHFEVHAGTFKNPIEPTGWLRAHGVEIDGCTPGQPPATTDHDHDHSGS